MAETAGPEAATAGTAGAMPAGRSLRNRLGRIERAIGRWLRRHAMAFYVAIFFTVLGAILLAPNIFITVPPGHVAVMWYRFFGGTVVEDVYGEGMHVIFPWDRLYIYDARLQNTARVYDTISSNGLSMQVEIAVRYRINRDTAGLLHKLVGPDFPEILVYPEIGSHARELISRYTPEQLYTETRAFIQAEILERMVNQLGSSLANQSFGGRLVTVEDVLLRSVRLPPVVADAIERKAAQYQLMLEYDFRIAREEKERQRKRIEAEGVRDFQDIVARTITQEYLRLRGIEATLALSTSNNSKTVIVGGSDGLPIILNTEGGGSSSTQGSAAAGGQVGDGAAQAIIDQAGTPPNARAEDPTSRPPAARKAAGDASSGSFADPLKPLTAGDPPARSTQATVETPAPPESAQPKAEDGRVATPGAAGGAGTTASASADVTVPGATPGPRR